ncbi:two-component system regulatory protein YycI [Aerococcaceae bacterium DSM 111021]|nr:two-component system regulatory protein YycI [Aerococcaceae bacterium DSM 111021]
MDFKRIQIVLVFFFLVFDVYLLFMLFSRAEVAGTPSEEIELTIEENLSNRGVSFSELSTDKYQLPFVVSETSNHLAENISQLEFPEVSVNQEGVLTTTLSEPMDLGLGLTTEITGLSTEQRQSLQDILEDPALFISGEMYRNIWYVNSEKVIYARMTAYDGSPIVDGTAEIRINLNDNFMMTGYSQTYQGNIVELEKERSILSEREALEIIDRRVETLIPDDSTIHYSILVYYRQTELDGLNVYSPAWQIVYDNANGRFTLLVDGIRGNTVNRNQFN